MTETKSRIIRITYEPDNREQWLELRRRGIGGSDAGAILGLNEYSSAYQVWLDKTGQHPGFEGNLTTAVGSYLESFVSDLFTCETGKKVRKVNAILTNPKYPFALANIDRDVVGEKALLEVKTTTNWANVKMAKNGEYPQSWYVQCMHYLMVTEYDRVYLAVLLNNRDFKIFIIERDEAEIASLAEQERLFWNMVVTRTQPNPNGSKGDSEAISLMVGAAQENLQTVDLFDCKGLIEEYISVRESVKVLDQRIEAIKQQLQLRLGNAERGECDQYKVSWENITSSRFDVKRFLADNPGKNFSHYYNESASRRFEIN